MTTHRGGNSREYAMQRLAEAQQFALLAQVRKGVITARAAMLEAGFSYPKIELRIDTPYAVAKALREHVRPEFLAELRRLLDDE